MLSLFIAANGNTRRRLVDVTLVTFEHVFVCLDSSKQKGVG